MFLNEFRTISKTVLAKSGGRPCLPLAGATVWRTTSKYRQSAERIINEKAVVYQHLSSTCEDMYKVFILVTMKRLFRVWLIFFQQVIVLHISYFYIIHNYGNVLYREGPLLWRKSWPRTKQTCCYSLVHTSNISINNENKE